MQSWLDDLDADEARASPHAGVPRPYQPLPKIPAAKPAAAPRKRAVELPPEYFIVTNLWRPQSVETIARTRALPKVVVETLLGELAQQGKVRQIEGGLWERVQP